MQKFKAILQIIDINPYVSVPPSVLQKLFTIAGADKGKIPVCGTVNGKEYKQTLLMFRGDWRLYINTTMLKDSPKRIGEKIEITIDFDPSDRTIKPHPKLAKALKENKEAKTVFDALAPSRRKEIIRYISFLKTEASIDRNVQRAINFLLGKDSFVGREKP